MTTELTNTSGIHPKGNKILILPEQAEEVSKGGILMPEITQEREAMAKSHGQVVEVGTHCFIGEPEPWCKNGDFIYFAMYAGQVYKGADGKQYRLIRDKDVIATVDK